VFAGKTPWDTGNFNPAAYATLAGPVFTTSISTNISGTGTSAFHAVGDFGAGFAGWSTTSSAVVQIDAPAAGASYLGMRWTRNGGRHFAGIFGYEGGSGTSAPIIAFLTGTDSAPGFTFSQGGNGSYTGSWSATSDYRVKTNVVAIDPADAITRLCRTRPVEYDRIETAHSGKRFSGFIAHELQEEFPLSVHGTKDAIKDELATSLSGPQRPPKKIPDLQSVDYTSQIPYQTASIQYLYTQLQAALARIDALEAK
jgi:hypothetical protein